MTKMREYSKIEWLQGKWQEIEFIICIKFKSDLIPTIDQKSFKFSLKMKISREYAKNQTSDYTSNSVGV